MRCRELDICSTVVLLGYDSRLQHHASRRTPLDVKAHQWTRPELWGSRARGRALDVVDAPGVPRAAVGALLQRLVRLRFEVAWAWAARNFLRASKSVLCSLESLSKSLTHSRSREVYS